MMSQRNFFPEIFGLKSRPPLFLKKIFQKFSLGFIRLILYLLI